MSRKPRTPARAPRGVEIHLDQEAMHALYDGAAATIAKATDTERRIVAMSLAKAAAKAIREGTGGSGVFFASYGRDELQQALEGALTRFVQAGGRQVAGELARQAAARPAGARTLSLADPKRPRGTRSARVAAAVSVAAAATAALMLAEMQSAAALAVT